MRARCIASIVALGSVVLLPGYAEDFSLTQKGFGPITVHTTLTYEGKGERLVATAVNDSGQLIPYVKLCVTGDTRGCLFEMWITERWEPGGSLSWNLASARHVPTLTHQVKIEVLNLPPAADSGVGSASSVSSGSPGQAKQVDKTPIPQGITVCLQPMAGGFDTFLIGEMSKQQVPVVIIAATPNADDPNKPQACDPKKSLYTMSGDVMPEGKSFSARSIFGLRLHLRDEVQGAVKLIRNSDNAIVWAGDSDRGEATKVAEHIVNQMLKQRPAWIPSPINR
jgi:hypothetical protein